jgi:hypothetical protein
MHLRLARRMRSEHAACQDAEIRDLKTLVVEIQAGL